MKGREQLPDRRLALRLAGDFGSLGFGLGILIADRLSGSAGWARFDTVCVLILAWFTFTDVWNWKDPGLRFIPVRRRRP